MYQRCSGACADAAFAVHELFIGNASSRGRFNAADVFEQRAACDFEGRGAPLGAAAGNLLWADGHINTVVDAIYRDAVAGLQHRYGATVLRFGRNVPDDESM